MSVSADIPFSTSDLLSHPDRRLIDHIDGVYDRLRSKVDEKDTIVRIVAFCHDIAKASPAFQRYIRKLPIRSPQEKQHSPLSALIAFYCTGIAGLSDEERYLVYSIVKNHHGYFSDLIADSLVTLPKKILADQWRHIHPPFIEEVSERIGIDLSGFSLDAVLDELEGFVAAYAFEGISSEWLYFRMQTLMSALVASDREDVVLHEKKSPTIEISSSAIDDYVAGLKREGRLAPLRDLFYDDARKISIDGPGIYSLSAPTGIGKTLANLRIAAGVREKRDDRPLIVYALPFINIIEQTYDTADAIFGDAVSAYHHLASIVVGEEEDEQEASLAYETWDSAIVVTTFVSLLEGIITNSRVPYFHRLCNAIIILDEVQSIPYRHWGVVRYTLEHLVALGATIIFSTATLPAIVPSVKAIGSVAEVIRPQLNRTRLHRMPEMDLQEFAIFVREQAELQDSLLVICNTVREAETVFMAVEDLHPVYLSSRVLPAHRRERVKMIKEGKCRLCIATQVVEAGVDISLNRVIRDIGPFDSIIQAAGRCNRHYESETACEVFVVPVRDKQLFSTRIYGETLTHATVTLLPDQCSEIEYHEFLQAYFAAVMQNADTESREMISAITQVEWNRIADFGLIEKRGRDYPFLVLSDKKAEMLFEEAVKKSEPPKQDEDRFAWNAQRRKALRNLAPYSLSLRIFGDPDYLPPMIIGRYVVKREDLERYYRPDLGLHLSTQSEEGVQW
ncbi:CRISPR-associated helicase Cas3' [Methanofollis fontis]|nr:CRISPR-associated helicase Cas3' [Methanofollis fontis]